MTEHGPEMPESPAADLDAIVGDVPATAPEPKSLNAADDIEVGDIETAAQSPDWARLGLLAATFAGVVLVLGQGLFTASDRPIPRPDLPEDVPISNWQMVESKPFKPKNPDDVTFLSGRDYVYERDGVQMDVTLRYVRYSDGNVSRLLQMFNGIPPATAAIEIRSTADGEEYGVFDRTGRAYLGACINPRGGSTVQTQEFVQNRYKYDVKPARIVSWALGQADFLDRRCLFTAMSISLEPEGTRQQLDPEAAYRILGEAWKAWYSWWQPNFPPEP